MQVFSALARATDDRTTPVDQAIMEKLRGWPISQIKRDLRAKGISEERLKLCIEKEELALLLHDEWMKTRAAVAEAEAEAANAPKLAARPSEHRLTSNFFAFAGGACAGSALAIVVCAMFQLHRRALTAREEPLITT